MDLESRMLYAPKGRNFVFGATPVNVINPYFEKHFVKFSNIDKYFILKGNVMILPVSPTSSLCLYDPDVYDFTAEDEKTVLSESDMDALNKLQIFTSEIDGGIVCREGDEEYVRELRNPSPGSHTVPVTSGSEPTDILSGMISLFSELRTKQLRTSRRTLNLP